MRARYDPPAADDAVLSAAPIASEGVFGLRREAHAGVVPWIPGEAAANSMPPPVTMSEDDFAEARAAAHMEGLAAGRAQAQSEFAVLRASFLADAQLSLESVAQLRTTLLAECRHDLAQLALASAEAVLQRELGDARATLDVFLQQALLEMDPHERCTISVATDDAATVMNWAATRWPASVVRADAALGPGELRVEATSGRIDVTHARRIERVRRLVLGDGEPT